MRLLTVKLGAVLLASLILAAPAPTQEGPTRTDLTAQVNTLERLDRYGDPLPLGAMARLGTVRFRHEDMVDSLALSPDGKLAVTTARLRVYLWGTATGKLRRYFEGHRGHVRRAIFSPNGKYVASGGLQDAINLLDVATGTEVRRFEGHEKGKWAYPIAFTRDGSRLISDGGDLTTRIWNVATGKEIHQHSHPETHGRLIVNHDRTLSADACGDRNQPGDVKVWKTTTGKEVGRVPCDAAVSCLTFAPDGKSLVLGGGQKAARHDIHFCDWTTGKTIRSLVGHRDDVYELAFSPDSRFLVSSGLDQTMRVWDVAEGKEQRQIETRLRGPGDVKIPQAFSPDGMMLYTIDAASHYVDVLNFSNGQRRFTFDGPQDRIASVLFAPDGKHLVVGALDALYWWDLTGRREWQRDSKDTHRAHAFAYAPDGKTLTVVGHDGVIRLDAATRRVVERWTGNSRFLPGEVALASDGRTLAQRDGEAKTVRLLEPFTGKVIREWDAGRRARELLAFSQDGRFLATAGGNDWHEQHVYIWDVASGRQVIATPKYNGGILCMAFSPDGKAAASASWDHVIHIWETATGRDRVVIRHPGFVTTLCFSPDGRTLATGNGGELGIYSLRNLDWDNRQRDHVLLWDLATGRELYRFGTHQGGVTCLAFSPDGKYLGSGSNDTTVLLWDLGTIRQRPTRRP